MVEKFYKKLLSNIENVVKPILRLSALWSDFLVFFFICNSTWKLSHFPSRYCPPNFRTIGYNINTFKEMVCVWLFFHFLFRAVGIWFDQKIYHWIFNFFLCWKFENTLHYAILRQKVQINIPILVLVVFRQPWNLPNR